MKIGIVLISDGWSGTENAVYNLSKNLIKLNLKVNLFINDEIFEYYKDILGVDVNDVGPLYSRMILFRLYSFIKIRKKILELSKKKNLDIILLFLPDSTIVSHNLSKKIKIPIVLTLRGGELDWYYGDEIKSRHKYFFKKSLEQCTKILSVNYWQLEKLEKKYKNKIHVIPNGIDLGEFRPLKSIKSEKNVVLFVGKFIELKGIKEILAVAKQLPKYEFWFAGQGPLGDLINLPNTKNLGFKNKKELIKLYNQATICVFPSYKEGFPNVALEATACGKAVIATPLGFSEYIENGKDGIIIPAKDEKALKDAIVKLMINENLRKNLEKNARRKALKYSWDKIARQYFKFFKEVIKENKNETSN